MRRPSRFQMHLPRGLNGSGDLKTLCGLFADAVDCAAEGEVVEPETATYRLCLRCEQVRRMAADKATRLASKVSL